jgi:hypothetical protein
MLTKHSAARSWRDRHNWLIFMNFVQLVELGRIRELCFLRIFGECFIQSVLVCLLIYGQTVKN